MVDMVQYTDKLVGRIVHKLEELKIRDSTVVLFTGDNGTDRSITSQTVNGPVRGGKGLMTNAGTHVPLIVSWPGTAPKGKVLDDLVDFSDFLPTFADMAGAKLPENRLFDGHSFLPQLKGQKGQPREWVFCHYWGYGRNKAKAKEFARDQRWKLYNDGRFYDLQADPMEKTALTDIVGEAKAARVRLQAVFGEVGSKLKRKE